MLSMRKRIKHREQIVKKLEGQYRYEKGWEKGENVISK